MYEEPTNLIDTLDTKNTGSSSHKNLDDHNDSDDDDDDNLVDNLDITIDFDLVLIIRF